MGQKDLITRDFLKDNVIFADTVNYYVYQGKQVIKPDDLKPLDTVLITESHEKKGLLLQQRNRDVLKLLSAKEDGKRKYLILGIESQSEVHYAMPVRNMLYDAMQYQEQLKQMGSTQRKNRATLKPTLSYSSAEFLSEFQKENRLVPVITIVVNFSMQEWDGAISLHELLDVSDQTLLQYIPDYRINLISPHSMTEEEANLFQSDMREVMLFLKYANDKEKLASYATNNQRLQKISRITAQTISIVSHSELKFDEREEHVNMCKAIRDMVEESREEGRILQFIETSREYGASDEKILKEMMVKFRLSEEKARERLLQ